MTSGRHRVCAGWTGVRPERGVDFRHGIGVLLTLHTKREWDPSTLEDVHIWKTRLYFRDSTRADMGGETMSASGVSASHPPRRAPISTGPKPSPLPCPPPKSAIAVGRIETSSFADRDRTALASGDGPSAQVCLRSPASAVAAVEGGGGSDTVPSPLARHRPPRRPAPETELLVRYSVIGRDPVLSGQYKTRVHTCRMIAPCF